MAFFKRTTILFDMPEKSLTEIPRVSREPYEKGVAAFQRQNYDYAIAIFTQVLQKEPAFYECREALRASQHKKAGAASGFFKKVLNSASSSPLIAKGQIALRTNPVEALNLGEQILNSDPQSVSGHKLVAEAAMSLDLPKTAILSLEIVVKNAPKDKNLALLLARAYSAANLIDKAVAVYTDLAAANPGDPEIALILNNLSARKTLKEGGYEALEGGQGSYRDILKNKEEAVALEQGNRQVKSEDVTDRLIQEYEARFATEPANLSLGRAIAELYVEKKEFDKAFAYFAKVQAAGSGDATLDRAISEAHQKKFDHALAQLDQTAPDYAERSEKIRTARDQFVLDEAIQRAERYPNDLLLRFELGQLYFKAGKIKEAMPELQKAQANPHRRIQATSLLGQCFARRGMNDMAADTLRTVLKEKTSMDEEKKDLLYALGTVLEKMGKRDEAIEPFKQIYQTDMSYRDVADKVDRYYSGS
jgi:tetratricopeptide (TPR) repeat protein